MYKIQIFILIIKIIYGQASSGLTDWLVKIFIFKYATPPNQINIIENEKLAQDFKLHYNIVQIYWIWPQNLMYGLAISDFHTNVVLMKLT